MFAVQVTVRAHCTYTELDARVLNLYVYNYEWNHRTIDQYNVDDLASGAMLFALSTQCLLHLQPEVFVTGLLAPFWDSWLSACSSFLVTMMHL